MMDEHTFQRELMQLKARLSQMAATLPKATPLMSPNDAFLDQLQDVKTRLDSLNHLTADRSHRGGMAVPHPMNATMTTDGSSHFSHSNLTLPSGPLFWQLFTSLRTDVRSLHSRVADLEQNVSDLEDHVDRLDPQITPPASDADIAPYSLWEPGHSKPFSNPGYSWSYESNDLEFMNGDWYPGHMQRPSELDTDFPSLQGPSYQPPTGCNTFGSLQDSLQAHYTGSAPPEGVAFRDREIAQLEELMRVAQESLQKSEDLVSQKDGELARQHVRAMSFDAKVTELEATLAERESLLANCSEMLSQKQSDIDTLEASLRAKEAEVVGWTSKHDHLRQSYIRKRNQLVSADHQIQHLQRARYEQQRSKQDEMEELLASKEDEGRRMRDFCDSKDAVIHQQEQIIARGATLMQERDEEIGRVTRELQVVKDDLENERRQKERFSRLFDERGEVISQLRASLNQALTPQSFGSQRRETKDTTGADQHDHVKAGTRLPYSPFATAGIEAHTPNNQKWTPKAIRGFSKMPHEEKRAVSWETGRTAVDPQTFGKPSPMGRASPRSSDLTAESHKKDLRRCDSLKLLQRLALVEEGSSSKASIEQKPQHSKRNRLSLEDLSSRPPLPAPLPLPPLRLSSVVDLSPSPGVASDESHKLLSKHRSLQELPRRELRSLQAYVEEGETTVNRGERSQ